MPNHQPQAPPTNPALEPTTVGSLIDSRLRWLDRLPLGVLRHATVSTVPSVQGAGQTARPGIQEGCTMTEASVSFAGNLTDQPELRRTEAGIARAMFRVVVVGRLQQRSWTAEDGSARSTVEVLADELGPSLAGPQ
jgi:hypothetical protein